MRHLRGVYREALVSVTSLRPPTLRSGFRAHRCVRLRGSVAGPRGQMGQRHHKEVHTHRWYFDSGVPGLATLCLHGFIAGDE
jgi:hypothetical protein